MTLPDELFGPAQNDSVPTGRPKKPNTLHEFSPKGFAVGGNGSDDSQLDDTELKRGKRRDFSGLPGGEIRNIKLREMLERDKGGNTTPVLHRESSRVGSNIDVRTNHHSRSTAPTSMYGTLPRSLTQRQNDDLDRIRQQEDLMTAAIEFIEGQQTNELGNNSKDLVVSDVGSEEPVQLSKFATAAGFGKVAGKTWTSSKSYAGVSSTISRDNTSGESARQAKLLAEFGRRGRPCMLTSDQAQQSPEGSSPQYERFSPQSHLDVLPLSNHRKNTLPIERVRAVPGQKTKVRAGIWQCGSKGCAYQNSTRNFKCLRCGASFADAALVIHPRPPSLMDPASDSMAALKLATQSQIALNTSVESKRTRYSR